MNPLDFIPFARPRARRAKPRPGRLRGPSLVELRRQCYQRDGGRCRECGVAVIFNAEAIYGRSYHMAHVKAKRMGGDSLENVRTLCGDCHRKEHQYGKSMEKPVPRKAG